MKDVGAKVLIVDDDEDVREILELVLGAEGFETDKAKDGLDALEHLRASAAPAVILLDLMMPRLDGEGFVAAMKANPAWADVPIVLMSGHNAARAKAEELAVADCLVKPVDIEQVVGVVRRLIAA